MAVFFCFFFQLHWNSIIVYVVEYPIQLATDSGTCLLYIHWGTVNTSRIAWVNSFRFVAIPYWDNFYALCVLVWGGSVCWFVCLLQSSYAEKPPNNVKIVDHDLVTLNDTKLWVFSVLKMSCPYLLLHKKVYSYTNQNVTWPFPSCFRKTCQL